MTDTTRLPPLPERECSLDSGQLDLFTGQQMREYGAECRRMALDEAAQAAGPEDSYQDEWFKAKADAVRRILALKDKA